MDESFPLSTHLPTNLHSVVNFYSCCPAWATFAIYLCLPLFLVSTFVYSTSHWSSLLSAPRLEGWFLLLSKEEGAHSHVRCLERSSYALRDGIRPRLWSASAALSHSPVRDRPRLGSSASVDADSLRRMKERGEMGSSLSIFGSSASCKLKKWRDW